jgi:hypothetical protein
MAFSEQEIRAAASAGRAAGYCWVEHGPRPLFCTRPPGHDGDHENAYAGNHGQTPVTGPRRSGR